MTRVGVNGDSFGVNGDGFGVNFDENLRNLSILLNFGENLRNLSILLNLVTGCGTRGDRLWYQW